MANGSARGASKTLRRAAAAAVSLTLCAAAPASAGSLEGAFLKARHAVLQNDAASAARFYNEALLYDPSEPRLIAPAFYFALMVGETARATRLAPRLSRISPEDRMARLSMIVAAFREDRFDEAELLLGASLGEALSPLTRQMLRGWAAYGREDRDGARRAFVTIPPALDLDSAMEELDSEEARAAFKKATAQREALQTAFKIFGQLNLGLMAAAEGRDADALAAFETAKEHAGVWTLRLTLEAGGALRRLGRTQEAIALYDQLLERDRLNPRVRAARADALAGRPAELLATTAHEGAALVLHGVSVSLSGDDEDSARQGLYYAQLARYLAPGLIDARVVAAEQLAAIGQYRLAAEAYAGAPPQSALGEVARVGRADSLAKLGDYEGSLSVLRRLAAEGSDRPSVYLTIASLEGFEKRFAECAAAYEKAISLMDAPNWRVLLRLGVCREQGGDWAAAEAAFVEALDLEPEQPDVLNHFGYGLVEQGRRLEEARAMIETAVKKRPDSGYIVDSLGWVLYRLGDYEAAVKHLENAVALAPSESVINDHFGDALWRVGRKMEARFQWRRALSYEPKDDERPRIERKLEIGLDAVLAEEQRLAAPETPAQKKVEAVDSPSGG